MCVYICIGGMGVEGGMEWRYKVGKIFRGLGYVFFIRYLVVN